MLGGRVQGNQQDECHTTWPENLSNKRGGGEKKSGGGVKKRAAKESDSSSDDDSDSDMSGAKTRKKTRVATGGQKSSGTKSIGVSKRKKQRN